jgi:rhodanese-related sulfurtransferase
VNITADDLVAEARAQFDRVPPEQAAALLDDDGVVVDIRPLTNRLAEGEIPGAVIVERIVLEWRLDPAGEHRLPGLTAETPVVIVCNEGYASSLAATSLQDIGIGAATDMIGGFRSWRAAGLPVAGGISSS